MAVRKKKVEEVEEEEEEKPDEDDEGGVEMSVDMGPFSTRKKEEDAKKRAADAKAEAERESEEAAARVKNEKVVGGAWGAGASKDSVLLKLIAEQSGGIGSGQ